MASDLKAVKVEILSVDCFNTNKIICIEQAKSSDCILKIQSDDLVEINIYIWFTKCLSTFYFKLFQLGFYLSCLPNTSFLGCYIMTSGGLLPVIIPTLF